MARDMDMESGNQGIKIQIPTKESTKKTIKMDSEYINGPMEQFIEGPLKMISNMARG